MVSLISMFEKSQFVNKFRLNTMLSGNLFMLLSIYTGLDKSKSPEYVKECENLLLPFIDFSQNIILAASPDQLGMGFKLFQKVAYLLKPGEFPSEKIATVYKKLLDIEKKINSVQDESLSLIYVETLGKFLLSHIEKLEPTHKKELLIAYYHKFFELYINAQTKKYQTLVRKTGLFGNF